MAGVAERSVRPYDRPGDPERIRRLAARGPAHPPGAGAATSGSAEPAAVREALPREAAARQVVARQVVARQVVARQVVAGQVAPHLWAAPPVLISSRPQGMMRHGPCRAVDERPLPPDRKYPPKRRGFWT